jgi:hypothetical protein
MVFILPMEFMAQASDGEMSDMKGGMAQLALDPMPATFEKLEEKKHQYFKALFLKGQVDGRPVTKLLVDGGAAVIIMPYAMFRKLGKGEEDLMKIDMMLNDFEGNVSPAQGALCIDLTIGSKTLPTTLFVVNGKGSYNFDEDISPLHTMQGPITRARARRLDHQVRSNLVNCFSEHTLGSMHVLLIRTMERTSKDLEKAKESRRRS